MDIERWPQLGCLLSLSRELPTLQVWLFGSARYSDDPADLDVLLIYTDRSYVVALRKMRPWTEYEPPIHIIAMTSLEVAEYDFVATTGAIRLV